MPKIFFYTWQTTAKMRQSLRYFTIRSPPLMYARCVRANAYLYLLIMTRPVTTGEARHIRLRYWWFNLKQKWASKHYLIIVLKNALMRIINAQAVRSVFYGWLYYYSCNNHRLVGSAHCKTHWLTLHPLFLSTSWGNTSAAWGDTHRKKKELSLAPSRHRD